MSPFDSVVHIWNYGALYGHNCMLVSWRCQRRLDNELVTDLSAHNGEDGGSRMTRSPRAPAVLAATKVLVYLAHQASPQGLHALVRGTGLPKTSVLRICKTLVEARMLSEGSDGTYWLGPHIAELGAAFHLAARGFLRIGLLIPSRANAFYGPMLTTAESHIEAMGGELHLRDADNDGRRQRDQWRELLDLDLDVILVDSVDSGNLGGLVRFSHDRGVIVLACGSRMSDVDGSVTSDNTQAGLLAGHFLASHLVHGRVAVVDGLRKNANVDRVAGFVEALRDHAGIAVCAHIYAERDDIAAGFAAGEELLATDFDVDGIFAVCDPIALGVASALRSARREIPITSVDGRAEAVDQIVGRGPVIATAAQDPGRIARASLDLATDLHLARRSVQRTVLLPVRLITAANASSYRPWG